MLCKAYLGRGGADDGSEREGNAVVFGGLIAWYLFLGSTAAGTFAILAAIDLYTAFLYAKHQRLTHIPRTRCDRRTHVATQRTITQSGYATAFILLAVGMLCLLADLGRPEAFYLLFLYPTSSFVSIGTFALALFGACLTVALAESVLALGAAWKKVALVAKVLGTVAALVVMVYTGLLLKSVVAVDLWQSAWLPVLFLFSALSCGCGVVLLTTGFCAASPHVLTWMRGLAIADAAFIVCEVLATIACAFTVNAASSTRPFDALLVGEQAWVFWLGFVGCAILMPLVLEAYTLFTRHNHGSGIITTVAVLILAGGLSLRFALVNAGIQMAV